MAPKGAHLEPPKSSKPILTSSYESCPAFIAMVQEKSFNREEVENSYTHLSLSNYVHASIFRHVTRNFEVEVVPVLFNGSTETLVCSNRRRSTKRMRVTDQILSILLHYNPRSSSPQGSAHLSTKGKGIVRSSLGLFHQYLYNSTQSFYTRLCSPTMFLSMS